MSTEYVYKCDVCKEVVPTKEDLFLMGFEPSGFKDYIFSHRLPNLKEEEVCFDCRNSIQSLVDSLRHPQCKI